MAKYRIVTDNFNGFECQFKVWWMPFWFQVGGTNTHTNLDKAKNYIDSYIAVGGPFKSKVVAVFED